MEGLGFRDFGLRACGGWEVLRKDTGSSQDCGSFL